MPVAVARASAEDIRIAQLIREGRRARSVFQSTYNDFYSLAAPWRQRVGERHTPENPRPPSEQDEIFDTTLQEAVDDWASDCADEFTPSYRPWVTYGVIGGDKQFSKAVRAQIDEMVVARHTKIFDAIKASAFEEQSQEAYVDLSIGPTGMDIAYTGPGLPLSFEHIPLSELIIVPSPFGGVGDRFREREVPVRDLDILFPNADWSHYGDKSMRQISNATATIVEACTRDWYNRSKEVWTYRIMEGEVTRSTPEVSEGPGSCRFIVARPRVSSPSAYGVGPANKAIAPARTLDQMAYLALKREGRALNPPVVYSDDGTLNVEAGLDDGVWYEAGEGFEIKELYPQSDAREVWFKEEELRATVRRSLFQDKPYQRGDTPPTATQWMNEEERVARRKGFPRARITNEWTLPIVRRTEWILRRRTEIEDEKIEGTLIKLEPISPMSRASDLNEVTMADRHIDMFAGWFGEQAMDFYDLPQTMENARKKMGTTVIAVASEDQVREKQQMRAMAEAASRGNIPGMEQG